MKVADRRISSSKPPYAAPRKSSIAASSWSVGSIRDKSPTASESVRPQGTTLRDNQRGRVLMSRRARGFSMDESGCRPSKPSEERGRSVAGRPSANRASVLE